MLRRFWGMPMSLPQLGRLSGWSAFLPFHFSFSVMGRNVAMSAMLIQTSLRFKWHFPENVMNPDFGKLAHPTARKIVASPHPVFSPYDVQGLENQKTLVTN